MTNRIYRVIGTNRHGETKEGTAWSEVEARRTADDMNAAAVKRGGKPDWRAEYADVTWKPLEEQD